MWFHFSSFNHDPVGRTSLVDLAAWFEAGLIDLGHKVTFSDRQVEPGAKPFDAGCIVRLIPSVWDNQHRSSGPQGLPACSGPSLMHVDRAMGKYLRVGNVRQHKNL